MVGHLRTLIYELWEDAQFMDHHFLTDPTPTHQIVTIHNLQGVDLRNLNNHLVYWFIGGH